MQSYTGMTGLSGASGVVGGSAAVELLRVDGPVAMNTGGIKYFGTFDPGAYSTITATVKFRFTTAPADNDAALLGLYNAGATAGAGAYGIRIGGTSQVRGSDEGVSGFNVQSTNTATLNYASGVDYTLTLVKTAAGATLTLAGGVSPVSFSTPQADAGAWRPTLAALVPSSPTQVTYSDLLVTGS